MPPTKHMTGDVCRGNLLDGFFNLVGTMTGQGILLVGMMPFAYLRPVVDPEPGGGLGIFLVSLVIFSGIAAYGVWGPGRAAANGERSAMLDLRVAFSSRIAIHCFFLTALVLLASS